MRSEQIKIEINKYISEMNGRILRLKDQSKKEPENKKLFDLLTDLENRRERITQLYNAVNSLKPGATEELLDLKGRIFKSIESFNEAYHKSGGILHTRRIGRKNHHIDFNNPGNTR